MSNKESVAEKSLTKFMQFLKDEETSLQKQIPLILVKLNHNKIMQALLLKIVSIEEKKEERTDSLKEKKN